MRKPIAVLTNNIPSAFQWLKERYKIVLINVAHRVAETEDGTIYVLITCKEEALAWEFSGYMVSPFYESLTDLVRSMVR